MVLTEGNLAFRAFLALLEVSMRSGNGNQPPTGQAVPPLVMRDVLDDGSYRDDELTASYYGGILASSRSGISRDDRGAAFTALVGRLTTYQLRAHNILYRTINHLYCNTGGDNLLWGEWPGNPFATDLL